MQALNDTDGGGPRGLSDLLSGEKSTQPGTQEDTIGFRDVEGIEIWEHNVTGGCSIRKQALSSDDDVAKWLENPTVESSPDSEQLCAKILVGNQVLPNDRLHPPEDAEAARFSRHLLRTSFHMPDKAIARVTSRDKWQINFPQGRSSQAGSCEGLGTSTQSFVMA